MPIWMQTMNEESKTTTTTDGRNDHCCSQEHTMGTAPLESNTGSLEDRTQVSQEGSNARTSDCCQHQDGSNGSCGSMASMARGSTTTKGKEKVMDLLDKARETCGERGKDYGHPFHDFTKIAKIWSVIFETHVTPEQVALAMIGVKMARICQNETYYHADSVLDICGYANCLEKVANYCGDEEYDLYPHIEDIFDA